METIFFRNKRITVLAVLMIIAAGISAILSVGRQEDPTISSIFATIVTPFPGADPARVEALVTEKIEIELREIPDIRKIESTSRSGISVVTAELSWNLSKVEIEQAWSEVRDALSDAARSFPDGVPEPTFDDDRTGAYSSISAVYAADGNALNDGIVRRYAELLQDRLRGVQGTKLVEIYGEREEQITVTVDPKKLTSIGLTPAQVSAAIANGDSKVSAGQVRGSDSDLLIEVSGEVTSLERIRLIPLASNITDAVIRVGDVAVVSRDTKQPADALAYANGKPAVLVAAKTEEGVQVDVWMGQVRSALFSFEGELPNGISHQLLFDQSRYTAERLEFVMTNMLLGVALVVAVLFLTLGWRAAIIVSAILPLAALLSLAGFQFIGIPVHQMSVTGLIVSLGLLVDAGIVMTDEIRKRLEHGDKTLTAVEASVRRLVAPLLASTITTALAFTPMALLPGPAGDFVGAIAAAVIIMLVSSFVLAITITPALAGWMLRQARSGKGPGCSVAGGIQSATVSRTFARSLDLALRFPKLAVLGALVIPLIGFGAFPTLKAQFFPGVDRDQFYVQVKLPDGSSLSRTERVAKDIDRRMRSFNQIEQIHWVVGRSAPPFYYNMLENQDQEPSFAEALVTTSSPAATENVIPELQRTLDKFVPQARVTVRGLVQGPPVNAPVEIRIVGPELSILREVGDRVREIMISQPDILQVKTQLSGGAPKAEVDIDEEKARLLGLDLRAVAQQLDSRTEGALGGSMVEATEELPIRVRLGEGDRLDLNALRRTEFVGANGRQRAIDGVYPGIPISALGTVALVPADTPIYRRNAERVNTVQGYPHRNVLPEEVLKRTLAKIDDSGFRLPPGYRFEVGGDADARNDVLASLLAGAGLIVALTIAAIVLTFNSFRLSLLTGIVSILAIGLSLLSLALFKYPFGIQAIIGVIGSIGVSINAAIIIMTALQRNENAAKGDIVAIREIVMAQSRHIVSTTVTTFGGFLPLILSGGGFWPPFAMAIAGGVLLSTVVSFYFVPPAFKLVMSRSSMPFSAKGVSNDDDMKRLTDQRIRGMMSGAAVPASEVST